MDSCALQFYNFQLGERNEMIGKIKDFLRTLRFLKNKPSRSIIFDASLLSTLMEFQRYKHLQVTDGYFNEDTYAALGEEMSPEQISNISRSDGNLIIGWLLMKKNAARVPFNLSRRSGVEIPNGNPEDEATDRKLANLLTSNGIVRAAGAVRGNPEINHFKLPDGKIYTIHIYGDECGNSTTGVYLPKFFNPPKYDGTDTVIASTKKGEVLGLAHIRVSSQVELDENYNSGKVNGEGSKYIGECGGLNGDSACYRHSHLHFFPNMAARLIIKNKKIGYSDPKAADSKYLLDVKELLQR